MTTRWAAFVVVGIGGFAVQLSAVTLLAHAGLADAAATGLAVELAILHNFVWHERWTWRTAAAARPTATLARLLRFNGATAVVSIAGNVALVSVLVGRLDLPLPAANALAVGALSVINFVIADRGIWGCKVDSGDDRIGQAGRDGAPRTSPSTPDRRRGRARVVDGRRGAERQSHRSGAGRVPEAAR